jgi:hypothetical protein
VHLCPTFIRGDKYGIAVYKYAVAFSNLHRVPPSSPFGADPEVGHPMSVLISRRTSTTFKSSPDPDATERLRFLPRPFCVGPRNTFAFVAAASARYCELCGSDKIASADGRSITSGLFSQTSGRLHESRYLRSTIRTIMRCLSDCLPRAGTFVGINVIAALQL